MCDCYVPLSGLLASLQMSDVHSINVSLTLWKKIAKRLSKDNVTFYNSNNKV